MAKFASVIEDIEGDFAPGQAGGRGPLLVNGFQQIEVLPANFQGGAFNDEFVRLEILPNRQLNTYAYLEDRTIQGSEDTYVSGGPGIMGIIIFQIYTPAGFGSKRTMEIADALDARMQHRSFLRGTQTGTSSLSFIGVDSQDNSLYRADYNVTFRNYGHVLFDNNF